MALAYWKVKSEDDSATIYVKVSPRGRETGRSKVVFADGRVIKGTYKPLKIKRRTKRFSYTFYLCAGFLSGILIQAATNALKLR